MPFFLRGYVRTLMPELETDYVLTDWKGAFAEAYYQRALREKNA